MVCSFLGSASKILAISQELEDQHLLVPLAHGEWLPTVQETIQEDSPCTRV